MFIVHVHVRVKLEQIEAFRLATVVNGKASIQEPGISGFDVFQQQDDPAKFLLIEVYRSAEAQADHKGTKHYATWRDTVASMMAEPRASVKYSKVFPADKEL